MTSHILYSFYLGCCTVCGCHWLQHRHITYEFKTNRTHVSSTNAKQSGANKEMSLKDIDKRITDLREEAAKIQDVYKKLAGFLHANAILPINDDIVEYLRYFIREEQMKQSAGAHNGEVISGLEKMLSEFTSDMELLKKTLKEEGESGSMTDVIKPEKIFLLVGTLYRLPITGAQIRRQVEEIKISEERYAARHEKYIGWVAEAAKSKLLLHILEIDAANHTGDATDRVRDTIRTEEKYESTDKSLQSVTRNNDTVCLKNMSELTLSSDVLPVFFNIQISVSLPLEMKLGIIQLEECSSDDKVLGAISQLPSNRCFFIASKKMATDMLLSNTQLLRYYFLTPS